MGARAEAPASVKLGIADTEIVAQISADETKQVVLVIGNVATAKTTFRLHIYDAGGAESADQFNAWGGFYDRELGPNGEETIVVSMHLTTGFKVSGQAGVVDSIVVNVFSIDL